MYRLPASMAFFCAQSATHIHGNHAVQGPLSTFSGVFPTSKQNHTNTKKQGLKSALNCPKNFVILKPIRLIKLYNIVKAKERPKGTDMNTVTKSEANAIYRAYKNNRLNVTKKFINAMYRIVKMDSYTVGHESKFIQMVAHRAGYAGLLLLDYEDSGLSYDRLCELAQAVIDGKKVEKGTISEVIREFEVTQDVLDNPEAYGIGEVEIFFYELGDMYTEETSRIDYVIA